ncbi:MAG: hypothetical protein K1Y36_01790 [Blastocatellia bacterium]|nr:hypothetical protein [Blastocatellia bacterium]
MTGQILSSASCVICYTPKEGKAVGMLEIHKQYLVDENQKPVAVVIPIEEFREIERLLGHFSRHTDKLFPDESEGLSEPVKQPEPPLQTGKEEVRIQRMAWIKSHRQEFAGQYVALDGDRLVGHGTTIREAQEQAKQQGIPNPFLVRLPAENEVLWGGW